jgi:hypothetical protein
MSYDPSFPQYAPQPPAPHPKKKAGKIAALGCGGILVIAVFGGCMAAISSSSGDSKSSSTPSQKTAAAVPSTEAVSKECSDDVYDMLVGQLKGEKLPDSRPDSCDGLTDKQWSQTVDAAGGRARKAAAADIPKATPTKKAEPKKDVVTFKVWGTAPAGVLGGLDITYGSDSDSLKGTFRNGTFTATLPLDSEAMYYNVSAQLQGSGDINCSVTVDGKTKKGHASGGYNICDAQLSGGLFGDWS